MSNLDVLLLKGPTAGELDRGLDELRQNVLQDGVPQTNDGLVNATNPL